MSPEKHTRSIESVGLARTRSQNRLGRQVRLQVRQDLGKAIAAHRKGMSPIIQKQFIRTALFFDPRDIGKIDGMRPSEHFKVDA